MMRSVQNSVPPPAAEPTILPEWIRSAVESRRSALAGHLRRWWENPLLSHARRLEPMPLRRTRRGILIGGGVLTLVAILAWIADIRLIGALLMGLSLGAVLLPVLAAPVMSADRVSRQMVYARKDPRRLAGIDPVEVAWGLGLVTLWKLRWAIAVGLVFTPVLMVGVLRIDLSEFTAWRESALALGDATPGARSTALLPDGRIPYLRLFVRAASAGLLPWALLPLMAALGVAAALRIKDLTLSPLVALLGQLVSLALVGGVWAFVSQTPLLAGEWEMARLALLVGSGIGLGLVTGWLMRWSAELLPGQTQPGGAGG